MRTELQNRLLRVASLLELSGDFQEKLALDSTEDKKSLWKKMFGPKTEVAPSKVKPTPESVLKNLDEKADRNFTPEKDDSGLFKKKPKPGPNLPKPFEQKLPGSKADISAFSEFIHGKGGIPLELAGPLKQISHALAAAGAVSLKDAEHISLFLARTLRKYLGGQKLAKVSSTDARKIRLSAKNMTKVAVLTNQHKVSNDGGYHYELESGKDPKDSESWDTKTGKVNGLYRGNMRIDGADCVMFQDDQGVMYAVMRQNAIIEEPDAVVAASYTGYKVSNDGGYHYLLDKGADPKNEDAWETEMGKVSGLYVGDITIDGHSCVMFKGSNGSMYAVLKQNAVMTKPEAVQQVQASSYTDQLKSFLKA